jgi:hypothetical protein
MDKFKSSGLAGEFGGIAALENEPPVNWLLPGYLAARELSCIYGKGGTLKSFIGIGWSLQLAALDKSVLYIAAEGTSGLRSRVEAWRAQHSWLHKDIPNWHYYNANVHVDQEKPLEMWAHGLVNYLYTEAERKRSRWEPHIDLIVVDTLARNFLGDENSAKEMGQFVEGCETLRRSLNAAVLVIHHEGITTGRDRGSPALRNATFAMFKTGNLRESGHGASISFECDRMKDAKAPDEVRIQFDEVALDVSAVGKVYQSSLAMRQFPAKRKVRRKK